jgi:hypothetical protein
MNPYEVLGVAPDATESEIKAAYRKAVKKYHPDSTKNADTTMVALVNEAYEMIMEPHRGNVYVTTTHWTETEVVEEDPREAYKREYLRQKREEAQAARETELRLFRRLYKVNVAIAVLAFLLVIDEFLPKLEYNEPVISEWVQERTVKRSKYYVHFMKTPHFTVAIPHDVHFDFRANPEITIEASPLFRIPTQIYHKGNEKGFKPIRTLFSFAVPFPYILLCFSMMCVAFRRHSPFAFSLSFGPSIMLIVITLFIWLTGG